MLFRHLKKSLWLATLVFTMATVNLFCDESSYDETYDESDLVYFYWDTAYHSYKAYAEYKADYLYDSGNTEDAFWYYRSLAYFYPKFYKGWWGIIRCFSGDFANLDFVDSEILIEKLAKSDYATARSKNETDVLAQWNVQLPAIQKAREERAALEAKKRADNLYNMKFVRHNGVLEQYNGSDPEVIIPEDVTVIGQAAFRQTCVKNVVFHKNVKEIQKDAFANCSGLKGISIPSTVKVIGEGAFCQCMNLESAEIPGTIEVLPNNLFQGCKRLTNVRIGKGVKEIGKSFTSCESLSVITIPSSVEKIGDFAFSACTKLTTISIMSDTVTVGKRTFFGTHLENKEKMIERFGEEAFK
ncbi:MAG: leucine-rich repeat domain-containing protein [Treponema sp.]|nr:leucine-rich repeat domain-containing protein [Treponema sp.]